MIGRRHQERSDLPEAMASLRDALERAEGRISEETVVMGGRVVEKVEGRQRHGTTHTLVAFLGATGGGKSSLTNAVVGRDVATVGIRRPTTSSTLACYWGEEDPQPLLDWLEVSNRHRVHGPERLDGLVLLDVPDHDSIQLTHRLEMERIAEHADLMVWVTDPEKYGDAAMHGYLRQLRGHGAVTTMVLNKADQLSADDLDRCLTDLIKLLADDGLPETPIVATSAIAIGGDRGRGINELIDLLATTVVERRTMVERLEADISTAASVLLDEVGPEVGPSEVPKKLRRKLAEELVDASGLAVVGAAVSAGHCRDASLATGWPFTRWLGALRPHPLRRLHLGRRSRGRTSLPEPSGVQQARTEGAVRTAVSQLTSDLPQPWPDVVRAAATPDFAAMHDRLDQAIADSVRKDKDRRPRWWEAVNVLQGALAATAMLGLVWLALLTLAAYFQLPEIPTPTYRRIPIPTVLVIGGISFGLLLAFLARRLASIGAKRRVRAVRTAAVTAVGRVADELVLEPMNAELTRRGALRRLLVAAGGQ